MIKNDIITRRKLRARALRIIKKLHRKEEFTLTKKIKFGSRYYIAHGKKDGHPVLFKSCIYPRSYDHLTNQKFSREVIFLNFIGQSKFNKLKQSTPHIYNSGLGKRAWYIREYLTGQKQNINGGNIRFKNTYFNKKTLDWSLSTILELQKIKKSDLPNNFKKLLYAPQTLNYMWQFISPYLDKIDEFTKIKNAGLEVKKLFNQNGKLYKNCTRVLAHQEIYSPHILKMGNQFKLIDWENVGWASIMKDPVTIWLRASKHPAWQKAFYQRFKRHYRHYQQFDRLWTTTTLLQSSFNIIGYYFYPYKKDFFELARFSGLKVNEILTNKFKKYN